MTPSQQVSFWSVHEFVQRYLDTAGEFPMCGSPAWCLLPDDSREKWAALLDFAQHHTLRVEVAQEQRAEASRAVAASADWGQVGREVNQRAEFRAAHPWSRRKAVS